LALVAATGALLWYQLLRLCFGGSDCGLALIAATVVGFGGGYCSLVLYCFFVALTVTAALLWIFDSSSCGLVLNFLLVLAATGTAALLLWVSFSFFGE
jgi:hypothetical protein